MPACAFTFRLEPLGPIFKSFKYYIYKSAYLVTIHPFNLYPEMWFEVYPVKFTLFFLGWQKHLRFFRVAIWKKAWFHKVNQKKMGAMSLKISGAFATLKE